MSNSSTGDQHEFSQMAYPSDVHDSSIFFETEHLRADLAGRSARGGTVTLVAQVAKFFLQLASNVFLARLLTPEDFGLVAMVAVVTGFVLMFKDMGLSMATVQKAEVNHDQISTLFWINVGFSLTVALITACLAPLVAAFYNEPRLKWITVALAFGLVLGGLSVQHQALIRRQMRFVALATVEVTSMFIGVLAAILAAWLGGGYWALVVLQLVVAASAMVGFWSFCGWRPGLPVRRSGVRKMLSFGANMVGFSFVNYFARNADKAVLGWRWGAQQVGFYSRAYALLLLPIGQFTAPITNVAVPALSRLQNEPDRYRNYYLKAIKVLAYLSMPAIVAMAVLSSEIIAVVLGEQWSESASLFRILAFAGFWQPVCCTVGWIYVSLGRTDRMFRWALISVPLIVLSFFVGLPWGGRGVAMGYAVCMWVLLFPMFAYACRQSPVGVWDVFSVICRPAMFSLFIGLAVFAVNMSVAHWSFAVRLAITLAVGTGVAGLVAFVWPACRHDCHEIINTTKLLFVKKRNV
jgi:O-antigen/teichoic acid export membrane protein